MSIRTYISVLLLLFFCHSVVSDSLKCHEWQHARLPWPSQSSGSSLPKLVSAGSVMPSNHHTICLPLLLLPSHFPSIRVFFNELVFHISRPKYWTFIISPSNEYLGLFSFRIDGLILHPKDSQESSAAPQFKRINSLVLSFLYGPTITCVHDYWKNNSFDYMNLCCQSDVSTF